MHSKKKKKREAERCKYASMASGVSTKNKNQEMEELQLPVCGGADKTHKKAAFWNATFLKLGKKVATAKVRKMQYSWKDNSLQPFDIIQKTILSSASF